MPYPTKWKKTTMRGCGPGCRRMDLPVESRMTGPRGASVETRHQDKSTDVGWIERCPAPR